MLLGREEECLRLDLLLDEARGGRSATLAIRGEAGIGKSALLGHARGHADGFRVLRAHGVESESELAFSALSDVFRPVLHLLEAIPPRQAEAMAGALAIGPAVSGDRFAVCAATLSLLAEAAEDSPLLVLLDDAQWLDPSSAQALLFAARRLESEGVLMLLGVRDGIPSSLDRFPLPELVVRGLDREASLTLLRQSAAHPVAPAVAADLIETTAGNPLALEEIPALLSRAQLSGDEPIARDAPTAPTVERALLRRVASLPVEARQGLVIAAASESGEREALLRAIRTVGLDPGALDDAEAAGLISLADDRVEFAHPLLRAAIYHDATAASRRAAHRALADTLGVAGTDRRAWHLAAAAPPRDREAAAALEAAAREARLRGGHAEAAAAFERASELTRDPADRSRLLRQAANDARLAGEFDRALALLDDALASAADPAARAQVQHLRGVVEMWNRSPLDAHALLQQEAALVEPGDRARATRMLTDAAWAALMGGELRLGLATAESAFELSGAAPSPASGVLGIALLLVGEAGQALPLLTAYRDVVLGETGSDSARQLIRPAGQVLMWFEEYDEARSMLARAIEAARAQSALGVLPYLLAVLSDVDFRTGNWAAAYAGAAEAVEIAHQTAQASMHAFSLACLARVEAAQGREEDCRAHALHAVEIADPAIGGAVAYADAALGLLELGLGRSGTAIEHLEQLASGLERRGLQEPSVVQWEPDRIEAYVRAGRDEDAARAVEVFEERGRAANRIWALAAAARGRGLLVADDEFEQAFDDALELHRRTPTPFERARTELCLGERRRRARRRSDARGPLRSALSTFEQLGARPWADRARAELEASGETARRRDPHAAEQLTPQELQVALMVAQGATNKEAGAALFLSPKTIESHLGRVYRKLNVRSRTELARLLATEGVLPELSGARST